MATKTASSSRSRLADRRFLQMAKAMAASGYQMQPWCVVDTNNIWHQLDQKAEFTLCFPDMHTKSSLRTEAALEHRQPTCIRCLVNSTYKR